MTRKDLQPQLTLPKGIYETIRNGSVGIVFKINDELCAKVLYRGDTENYEVRDNDGAFEELKREADIQSMLHKHQGNIWVPKPIRTARLKLFDSVSPVLYPAFFMRYLPFPSGADLDFYYGERARKQALEQIDYAMDQGFEPGNDCLNPNNFMYDQINDRTWLIDFGRWSFEGDNSSGDER